MDNTELHYLTYDPEAIWEDMVLAYIKAGGDVLYPGDEKEMLLRSVQADIVQVFAGVDNALRMQTLRYASGDYLDIVGEQRGCERIAATAAQATVLITTAATGETGTISAGTNLTCDGEKFYKLVEDFPITGYEQTATAVIEAVVPGSAGNGLTVGTQMQFSISVPAVTEIEVTVAASGGNDRERDEAYRQRIRDYGLTSVTTGPARQYEAAAMAVSTEIIDANAVSSSAGHVGIYLILEDGAVSSIIQEVEDALSDSDVRPLTDQVDVYLAEDVPYVLNVQYEGDNSQAISAAVGQAAAEYQEWQDTVIGRAFNPDRLMAMLYQAGCSRVVWLSGSSFDGTGPVQYTEISQTERCLGTITLTMAPTIT